MVALQVVWWNRALCWYSETHHTAWATSPFATTPE